jgi:hypothetical protein
MLTDNHPLTSWWILPATMAINDTKEKPMSDINVQRQHPTAARAGPIRVAAQAGSIGLFATRGK